MSKITHTIWSNDTSAYNKTDIRNICAENSGVQPNEVTDEEVWDEIAHTAEMDYEDEKVNLDRELDGRVLCIADLGLWNGRHTGYRMMGRNLNEVLCAAQGDCYAVGSDGRNIVARDTHHDGTNYYTFREVREDRNIEVLLGKLYDGTATARDIARYTKPITPYVNAVYGWGAAEARKRRLAAARENAAAAA